MGARIMGILHHWKEFIKEGHEPLKEVKDHKMCQLKKIDLKKMVVELQSKNKDMKHWMIELRDHKQEAMENLEEDLHVVKT
ncbi:unnamed protein product [Sphenostylis stenocarpa]|uniref:Uncharacterized protein n=1 Tax=Sphenostylis stenocarpa TaxID=92480 RepID=A0AA86S1V2_9FABA|nr:unnamed protein product [Sphenostylis stenocarpa]